MARNALSDRVANSRSLIPQKAWLLAVLSTGLEESAPESDSGWAIYSRVCILSQFLAKLRPLPSIVSGDWMGLVNLSAVNC
jgi:hypothetical protein